LSRIDEHGRFQDGIVQNGLFEALDIKRKRLHGRITGA
jgi:hypothetical protein